MIPSFYEENITYANLDFYNGITVGQAGRIQVGAERDQFPVLVPGVVMEKGKVKCVEEKTANNCKYDYVNYLALTTSQCAFEIYK